MRPVHARRRLQFRAGPQTHVFYACAECSPLLVAGDHSCFMPIPGVPAESTSIDEREDETLGCDFCREE